MINSLVITGKWIYNHSACMKNHLEEDVSVLPSNLCSLVLDIFCQLQLPVRLVLNQTLCSSWTMPCFDIEIKKFILKSLKVLMFCRVLAVQPLKQPSHISN